MPQQHADPRPANSERRTAERFPDETDYQTREREPAAGAAPEPASSYPVTSAEIAFGVIAVSAWLLCFASGTVIGTADERELLDSGDAESLFTTLGALFTVLTCYTITNVAFLAGLAAVAGEFSSRSRVSSLTPSWSLPSQAPQLREVLACYAAAAMRGFVIYLMFIAGLLLVTTEAITTPDQGQYVRLAGTISVLSFVAGYDSEMFRRALDRIVTLMSQTPHSDRQRMS